MTKIPHDLTLTLENKNKIPRNFHRFKSNSQLLSKLNPLQTQLHLLMNKSKQNYYLRTASNLTSFQKILRHIALY